MDRREYFAKLQTKCARTALMRNCQNIFLAVITPREELQQFAVNKRQFAITQENRSCNEGALAKSRVRYICKRNSARNIVTWYTTRHFVLKKRDF